MPFWRNAVGRAMGVGGMRPSFGNLAQQREPFGRIAKQWLAQNPAQAPQAQPQVGSPAPQAQPQVGPPAPQAGGALSSALQGWRQDPTYRAMLEQSSRSRGATSTDNLVGRLQQMGQPPNHLAAEVSNQMRQIGQAQPAQPGVIQQGLAQMLQPQQPDSGYSDPYEAWKAGGRQGQRPY